MKIKLMLLFVGFTPLIYGMEEKPALIEQNREANKQLFDAVESNDAAGVKKLLEEGANVNNLSRIGATPLMIAANAGNIEIMKLLIDSGADLDIIAPGRFSALSLAILNEAIPAIELLIQHGVDVNAKIAPSHAEPLITPLQYAKKLGNRAIIQLLSDAEALEGPSPSGFSRSGRRRVQIHGADEIRPQQPGQASYSSAEVKSLEQRLRKN